MNNAIQRQKRNDATRRILAENARRDLLSAEIVRAAANEGHSENFAALDIQVGWSRLGKNKLAISGARRPTSDAEMNTWNWAVGWLNSKNNQ